MTAAKTWAEFSDKLQNDQLTKADFAGPMGSFLYIWLSGPDTAPRREKFARAPARFWESAEKASVFLSCPDDTYRFDFVRVAERFALAFVECITLPVENLKVPCRDFQTLPEKEAEIRAEKEISRQISLYLKLKALLGQKEAVGAFLDGPGEALAARSWVPFYDGGLAFVAYAAWTNARLAGESVVLEAFSETACALCLQNHLYRKVYRMASHLRPAIPYDEYWALFEAIWQDRAKAAGWSLSFACTEHDTRLFSQGPCRAIIFYNT